MRRHMKPLFLLRKPSTTSKLREDALLLEKNKCSVVAGYVATTETTTCSGS